MITNIAEWDRVCARDAQRDNGGGSPLPGSPPLAALENRVLDFIFHIQQLGNRRQIEEELAGELTRLGIEYFLISERDGTRKGKLITGVVNPQAMHHYEEEGYLDIDPVIAAAEESIAPVIWSQVLARKGLTVQQKHIYTELSECYGIREGMCVVLTAPGHKTALANCGGFAPEFNARTRTSAQAMMLFTYNRLMHLEQLQHGVDCKITQREADCLSWVAQGKTDWEIGEILHISDNTAHWYIERAKRKLGVATRIQAVVTAIQFGIISI